VSLCRLLACLHYLPHPARLLFLSFNTDATRTANTLAIGSLSKLILPDKQLYCQNIAISPHQLFNGSPPWGGSVRQRQAITNENLAYITVSVTVLIVTWHSPDLAAPLLIASAKRKEDLVYIRELPLSASLSPSLFSFRSSNKGIPLPDQDNTSHLTYPRLHSYMLSQFRAEAWSPGKAVSLWSTEVKVSYLEHTYPEAFECSRKSRN